MTTVRCSILLPDDLRQDAPARGRHSTEKGTSTLMTALTRTEARELSRRFAEVGVDVSPGRLQQISCDGGMSGSERSDIEFAMLAHQVHLPGWTRRRQPTPQEWMISALRVLLGTAVTAAAGMSAAAITFLIVAVFPLHGVNYLIEHQTVIDHRSASPVVRFWLNPSVLTALSTVLIGGVGLQ